MCRTLCVLGVVALYVVLAHSWDIALSKGDLLEFYINATKIDTVRFENQNLAALAYDEVHNMMLYVDKQSHGDAVCGYNMSSSQYKCFTERNGRVIQGLAFDPATELCFFSDTHEQSINWFSLKPGSEKDVYGNFKLNGSTPTDIAVDSCRGYIYWIDKYRYSSIKRARFNGSETKIVAFTKSYTPYGNTTYKLESHSLVIDQQTQKMYWFRPERTGFYKLYKADLNATRRVTRDSIWYRLGYRKTKNFVNQPNVLTVSNKSLFMVEWCANCSAWEFSKKDIEFRQQKVFKPLFDLNNEVPVGIAANYKLSDQIQGIQECSTLRSLIRNDSNSFKTASEYVEPLCVHGVKDDGQSLCNCTPGHTGERDEDSLCDNHCIQGNCSLNDEGLPKCSCNAGYSGERCEVYACQDYCMNSGDCSLNEKSEPVCQCQGDYVGERCEVAECRNYCIQGNCTLNDKRIPECRCNAGYSGERCEVYICHSYCLNNGVCSLNDKEEPVCQCDDNHEGLRCEAVKSTLTSSLIEGDVSTVQPEEP